MLTHTRATPVAGLNLGVLHIESRYPLLPGHLQNAATPEFPVCYECVRGITPRQIVACDPRVKRPLIAAALRLQERGVGAVIGTCGSFVNFQSVLARALDIPVYSSVMIAAPLLLRSLPRKRKLLVVYASATSFTPRVVRESAIADPSRLVIVGCQDLPAFAPILKNENRLDSDALERQLTRLIGDALSADPAIGQILFQCSEFAPYARAVQQAFGLPVFDVTSLAQWIGRAMQGRL